MIARTIVIGGLSKPINLPPMRPMKLSENKQLAGVVTPMGIGGDGGGPSWVVGAIITGLLTRGADENPSR